MPKINQLSFDVANLIAAGEVVERPASVVKELLENAIDAEADAITVEIARGGVTLIRVADNGVGMTAEDLPLAIKRHATSKISGADDLASIATLGFRGEALAATAAVSTLTIITKTREAETGTMLSSVAGEIKEICEVGCADGTTVTVEELFVNVPARRKFLKKDVTETAAVTAVVEKIAVSRPDIAIRYITDGTVRFVTAGDGKLAHTLHALYGKELSSRLLPISGSVGENTVSGFVGRPDNARANRNMQCFFINGRYVKSKTVGAAVERAFTSYMAPERFPVAFIFLDMPHFSVDVNVHPAKLEVKFENERAVFEAVYYAVRTALEDSVARPTLGLAKGTKGEKSFSLAHSFEAPERAQQIKMPAPLVPEKPKAATPTTPAPVTREFSPVTVAARDFPVPKPSVLSPEASIEICERYAEAKREAEDYLAKAKQKKPAPIVSEDVKEPSEIPEARVPASQPSEEAPLPEYRILGTAFKTYVFVELSEEKILVIDQHAAHERILFERMKRERKEKGIVSTPLLLPISAELTAEEAAFAEAETGALSSLGFTYTFAEGKAHLLSIPADTTPMEAKDLFLTLVTEGAKGASLALSEELRREKMLYQIACKAAIKGGRHYDDAHIAWLVKEVLSLPDVTVCPHGRPIAFYLTKKELDRQFDRIK
ncbi:MAG: DNA mismatch repair endonuclease MutL [Ruminococcaceae bacterium]|nr:DNA mismatch repair endonuclease MutL [Oscillospiraceae bacterium]